MNGIARYRLLVDLTRYHPKFTEGAVGTIYHTHDDRFCVMTLDDGSSLKVLYQSIERVRLPRGGPDRRLRERRRAEA
jgi:hypothetical protein